MINYPIKEGNYYLIKDSNEHLFLIKVSYIDYDQEIVFSNIVHNIYVKDKKLITNQDCILSFSFINYYGNLVAIDKISRKNYYKVIRKFIKLCFKFSYL